MLRGRRAKRQAGWGAIVAAFVAVFITLAAMGVIGQWPGWLMYACYTVSFFTLPLALLVWAYIQRDKQDNFMITDEKPWFLNTDRRPSDDNTKGITPWEPRHPSSRVPYGRGKA